MLNLISDIPKILKRFLKKFKKWFTKKQFKNFKKYVSGLLLELKRTNIQTIDAYCIESNYDSLHHFLSNSPWPEQELNSERIRIMQASRQTKSCQKGVLVIDDTANKKSGKHTKGAQVQYSGSQKGLTNNNTVVTSHYVDDKKDFPIDLRPYLPASEFAEGKNSEQFFSKLELAKKLVIDALVKGVEFGEVTFDGWYLSNDFVKFLENKGLKWISTLPVDRILFYKGELIRTDELVKRLKPECFCVKEGTWLTGKKVTWISSLTLEIKGLKGKKRVVIETRFRNSTDMEKDVTVYITNNFALSDEQVTDRFGLRWGIEDFYRDAKDNLAFDRYQVRSIKAIKRHWYLVFIAYTFLVFSKLKGSFSKLFRTKAKTIGELLTAFRKLNLLSFLNWLKKKSNTNVFFQYLQVKRPPLT